MGNILKIVFLGLVGFGLLVFLTAEKPKKIQNDPNVINVIKYNELPNMFEIVGKEDLVSKEKIIKKEQTLILVANHDSLAIVKELPKYFDVKIPLVIVANISSAPWVIKKMVISSKLEELSLGSNIPMINDSNGMMAKALKVLDNTKTKYFAFLLSKEGSISKVYDGKVKEGALDGSMNEAEKKAALEPLTKYIK